MGAGFLGIEGRRAGASMLRLLLPQRPAKDDGRRTQIFLVRFLARAEIPYQTLQFQRRVVLVSTWDSTYPPVCEKVKHTSKIYSSHHLLIPIKGHFVNWGAQKAIWDGMFLCFPKAIPLWTWSQGVTITRAGSGGHFSRALKARLVDVEERDRRSTDPTPGPGRQ